MASFTKAAQTGREKRSPMKRTRMRQGGGAKGAATRASWRERRDLHLAANPYCVKPWPSICGGRTTVHHVQPRGMGGTKHDTSPLVTLCADHHDETESRREEARALGLLAPKGRGA